MFAYHNIKLTSRLVRTKH